MSQILPHDFERIKIGLEDNCAEYFRPKFEEILKDIKLDGECFKCEIKFHIGIEGIKFITDKLIDCLKNPEEK